MRLVSPMGHIEVTSDDDIGTSSDLPKGFIFRYHPRMVSVVPPYPPSPHPQPTTEEATGSLACRRLGSHPG